MPELPEVETVCQGLANCLLDATITAVESHAKLRRHPDPAELHGFCQGRTIVGVARRAKYLLVTFAEGDGLILHLGMTGAFKVDDAPDKQEKHVHVVWHLADGRSWRFLDPRRFGSIIICRDNLADALPAPLGDLGPEPLSDDFTPERLYSDSRNRRVPIKSFIMDQRRVVGVGNIYASEALYRARVSPWMPAGELKMSVCRRLVQEIKKVLAEAIKAGGTTISDFKTLDGSEGGFTVALQVYAREGKPCLKCGREISRQVIAGRSTFYCKHCQKVKLPVEKAVGKQV